MNKALTALWALIRNTVKRGIWNKRIVIVVLVALFLASVMGYAATQDMDTADEGSDLLDTLVISFFLPVMTMIYGSSLISDEIEDNSITQVLVSPLDRVRTFLGYYASLLILQFVIMVVITTSGWLAYFTMNGFPSGAFSVYSSYLGLVIIGSIVYSSLFIFVSIVMENPIYFGLVYAFIWESFIGSIAGKIHLVAIKHYIRSLGSIWLDHGGIVNYDNTGWNASIMVIFVVTAIFLIMGSVIFRSKEFP